MGSRAGKLVCRAAALKMFEWPQTRITGGTREPPPPAPAPAAGLEAAGRSGGTKTPRRSAERAAARRPGAGRVSQSEAGHPGLSRCPRAWEKTVLGPSEGDSPAHLLRAQPAPPGELRLLPPARLSPFYHPPPRSSRSSSSSETPRRAAC